ncbi:hypothetical protein F6X40_09650 [Paraburkholderia sp. UCT31]|uniref:hypothetical protein n=1 Tax=Paraburkholderia sp. UCT31 TaxID=2615209 RepID=UPI001655F366|nr:hypothetical protein [Paraburkholderia sp. UCT31]MBC8737072.1 hypothetical protein [Paraburkholderia sp. UCT31]
MNKEPYQRSSAKQELFVVDWAQGTATPDLARLRETPGTNTDEGCSKESRTAGYRKRYYNVCTTAFGDGKGAVDWLAMAAAVAKAPIEEKVNDYRAKATPRTVTSGAAGVPLAASAVAKLMAAPRGFDDRCGVAAPLNGPAVDMQAFERQTGARLRCEKLGVLVTRAELAKAGWSTGKAATEQANEMRLTYLPVHKR